MQLLASVITSCIFAFDSAKPNAILHAYKNGFDHRNAHTKSSILGKENLS